MTQIWTYIIYFKWGRRGVVGERQGGRARETRGERDIYWFSPNMAMDRQNAGARDAI